MKPFIPFSLLAAIAACGIAFGQAYTTPVGYESIPLVQGFNNVGLRLHPQVKISGKLGSITTTSVSDSNSSTDYATSLGVTGKLHVLEVTSGDANGLVTEISSWSGGTISTVDDLVAAGVSEGDSYSVRVAPTLEEVFGTNPATSTLASSVNANTADVVWVPTATPGSYDLYFLSTLNGGSFRRVAPPGAAPNVPLVYLDGLFVQKKGVSPGSLVVTGEVKTGPTAGRLVTGFNYVGTVYPVGSTIQNIGLEDDLAAGTTPATADVVWIPTSTPGQYTLVFYSTLGGGQWRTVAPPGIAPVIDLPGAIFIQRKGGTTPFDVKPPSNWSIGQ